MLVVDSSGVIYTIPNWSTTGSASSAGRIESGIM
nr:MAG TPA: hypothetical protein [Caudoviricetes sp.]